ncbi:MAG: hypothetical protein QNJ70_15045 [Xenococcaceae cyanobacterium MO_207.B15]|nr:hypothetical protein [Xenococcaceae cyanobacterium MO_207.B15]
MQTYSQAIALSQRRSLASKGDPAIGRNKIKDNFFNGHTNQLNCRIVKI